MPVGDKGQGPKRRIVSGAGKSVGKSVGKKFIAPIQEVAQRQEGGLYREHAGPSAYTRTRQPIAKVDTVQNGIRLDSVEAFAYT